MSATSTKSSVATKTAAGVKPFCPTPLASTFKTHFHGNTTSALEGSIHRQGFDTQTSHHSSVSPEKCAMRLSLSSAISARMNIHFCENSCLHTRPTCFMRPNTRHHLSNKKCSNSLQKKTRASDPSSAQARPHAKNSPSSRRGCLPLPRQAPPLPKGLTCQMQHSSSFEADPLSQRWLIQKGWTPHFEICKAMQISEPPFSSICIERMRIPQQVTPHMSRKKRRKKTLLA